MFRVFKRNLFVVSIEYKASLKAVDSLLDQHRQFLEKQYQEGNFIASGRKIPRTGGIILASVGTKEKLQKILDQDPFKQHDVADYQITEFSPTMHNAHFASIAHEDFRKNGLGGK